MSRVRAPADLLWLLSVLGAAGLHAQISPGPLARPHAALEGALHCITCHAGGKAQMSSRCLECHKEIAWLVSHRHGYHARQMAQRQRCAGCHPDHAGREFALITWPGKNPEQFDHTLAGWPLEGRHGEIRCGECHKAAFRKGPAAALAPQPASAPGWVGLETACASCHPDVHRRALGEDCASCHDNERWSPAPRFDHAKSDYPLTGKHRDVRCALCHRTSPGDTLPRFKPVAHGDCAACHADPHRGRFTGACSHCHVTRGFAVIENRHFSHDQTRYPLRGAHVSVSCAKCHDVPGLKTKDPPFATCRGCHADPHAGTATLAGAKVDCAACHSVAGFTVAAFSLAKHAKTRYPLEGKHRSVACRACHRKHPPGVPPARLGPAGILMRPSFARCIDCHDDAHGTQLTGRADRGNCNGCHVVAGWSPSTFTVADHATTRFTLDGRHAEIACVACHGTRRTGLAPLPASATIGKGGVVFRLGELACAACHVDPHQGQFRQPCRACHDTRAFRPSTVDVAAHDGYRFKLEGAHRAVPCIGCHRDLDYTPPASTLLRNRWKVAPLLFTASGEGCGSCHRNPHGDQFAADRGGNRCERCHGVEAFSPAANFDHDRDTKFPLRGGHAKVPCRRCHAEVTGPDHTRVVTYRPVPIRCESCHGDGARP